MAEKTIKVRLFEFYVEGPNPNDLDKKILRSQIAFFGDTVDIPREQDLARGEELNAFGTLEEVEALRSGTVLSGTGLDREGTEGTPGENPDGTQSPTVRSWEDFNPADADETTLASWISEEKPVVDRVLQVASDSDDPGLASRLLEAEKQALGGDARKGVVEGLAKIAEDKAQ